MTATTTERSLAPDLARGFMLLLIALAHAPAFVSTAGSAVLDSAAAFVKSLVADNQARAMFVFLFGYGLVQLTRRSYDRGADWPSIRGVLRRRGLWLTVIGFADAVFLVPLDIIAVYGVTLLALTPLVRARDSVLLWIGGLTLIPGTLVLAWQSAIAQAAAAAGTPMTMARYMQASYGAHILDALPSWPLETVVATLVVVPGMTLGIWAARRRVLDEPERHLTLLRRTSWVFLGVALVGRLPAALQVTGGWSAVAHDLTGYFGGIGLAALVGLVAAGTRRGRFTTALAALGQRSMTFYLAQSVVWLALFYPFTFDLRDDLGYSGAFAIAVAVWAISVGLAEWMRRAGVRGPAEVLLRRLAPTGGRRSSPGG